MLATVVDGIGHGSSAAAAAELAIAELAHINGGSLVSAVQRCHERLQRTRGVVLSLALFDVMESTMAWLSVGNVEGRLWRLNARRVHEALLLRGGVVGDHVPHLLPAIVPVDYGDLLVLATDGINSGFAEDVKLTPSTRQIAETIVDRHWQRADDALVMVARYAYNPQHLR